MIEFRVVAKCHSWWGVGIEALQAVLVASVTGFAWSQEMTAQTIVGLAVLPVMVVLTVLAARDMLRRRRGRRVGWP